MVVYIATELSSNSLFLTMKPRKLDTGHNRPVLYDEPIRSPGSCACIFMKTLQMSYSSETKLTGNLKMAKEN